MPEYEYYITAAAILALAACIFLHAGIWCDQKGDRIEAGGGEGAERIQALSRAIEWGRVCIACWSCCCVLLTAALLHGLWGIWLWTAG